MKFAVLNFKTTNRLETDEIVQVDLAMIDQLEISEHVSFLISTIKTQTLDEVMLEVLKRLSEDCVLIGYDMAMNYTIFQHVLDDCGYAPFNGRFVDALELLRVVYPTLFGLQLSMVCHSLGIVGQSLPQTDNAAVMIAEVFLQCIRKFALLPLITSQRISVIFAHDESHLSWFIHFLCESKEQSIMMKADEYRYYRQFALSVDDWGETENIRTDTQMDHMQNLSFTQFYEDFKLVLQQNFAMFEERKAQEIMISEVAETFKQGGHLMVEAGTGTGKSLGYLVPSLFYGIPRSNKVVISTHTINLQEQLRKRDIPLLHSIFPIPFQAAILKGRNHYLCLRKFEQKITYTDYNPNNEDRLTAAQMVVWLSETQNGDEEELHFTPGGRDFWHTVESDTNSCLNRACPWFKKCFYHRARNDANEADIIITNHSLLFTDIQAENRLLPAYKHLVIDEAHHFEEVAAKHLGIEIHYTTFLNSLLWLFKDSKSGQLPLLRTHLMKDSEKSENDAAAWCRIIDDLYDQIIRVKENWDELVGLLYQMLGHLQVGASEAGQKVLRIKAESYPTQWQDMNGIENNIHLLLTNILRTVEKLLQELRDADDELNIQSIATNLNGTVKDLYRHRDGLRFFMQQTNPNYVYWLEASPYFKEKSLQLICVPTDVSPMLQQYFFTVKASVIMTSATLSVDQKFDYTCRQMGLDAIDHTQKFRALLLPSPFDYRKQALVCIPRDFPGIKGMAGEAFFIANLLQSLQEVAIAMKGRMLVLFTSHKMLKLVHQGLKDPLMQAGILVLGQGVDTKNRSKLTQMFQENKNCVLLGTNSFWEGVDIPGDALSCLVIVRLPFQPPNHPIAEAKAEILLKNKQNPFIKLSVPQAVIRFKQGFGRLVRSANDRGIVIIYDTRVIDTRYGGNFLYSLPGPKIEHMFTNQLVPRINEWMEEGKE